MIGARRGHRVVERPVEPPEHAALGELGEQSVHRVVEAEESLADERQGGRGRHGLGRRRDAEERLAPTGAPPIASAPAVVDVHLVAVRDQRDHAGDVTVLHVPRGARHRRP